MGFASHHIERQLQFYKCDDDKGCHLSFDAIANVCRELAALDEEEKERQEAVDEKCDQTIKEKLESTMNAKDCPICLDSFNEKKSANLRLICGHKFHKSCVFEWTEASGDVKTLSKMDYEKRRWYY